MNKIVRVIVSFGLERAMIMNAKVILITGRISRNSIVVVIVYNKLENEVIAVDMRPVISSSKYRVL